MNIIKPIDYVIYKISRVYRMGLDKRDPEVWTRALLAFLIILNLATVAIWTFSPFISGKWFKIISLSFFIFLFLYYNESRFLKIEERYKNEPKKQKLWGSIAVITYVVATFVLFIGVVIYRNKLNGF